MAISEWKKNYNKEYDREHIKRFSLCMKQEMYDRIRGRAAELGKPVNRYIVDLIRQDMDANSGK